MHMIIDCLFLYYIIFVRLYKRSFIHRDIIMPSESVDMNKDNTSCYYFGRFEFLT